MFLQLGTLDDDALLAECMDPAGDAALVCEVTADPGSCPPNEGAVEHESILRECYPGS
jgi:hypothetical protein